MARFSIRQPIPAALTLLAIFVAAALLLYSALFVAVRSAAFGEWAKTELSRRSGMEIHFVDLTLRPPFELAAKSFRVSQPGAFTFHSARLTIVLGPLDLWLKRAHRITAERPVLSIDLSEIMSMPAQPGSATFGLRHLTLRDGSLCL